MGQFRYRLQMLLDQRLQAREDALGAVAALQRHLSAERRELDKCCRENDAALDRLRHARSERISPVRDDASGELLLLMRDHVARLHEEYEDTLDSFRAQELRVREIDERLAASRQELAARTRDVEVLQKHRARVERRFRDEAERKEVVNQEEMANVIFLQGRRES